MIDFISADLGHLELYNGLDLIGITKSPEDVARCLQENGIADSVFASSSIDFASEYGFETDKAASELWELGLSRYYAAKIN
tara:strand:- start:17 stop:259 length:243 start_codon:yes stop_codon:yes gene_type:complete